jgi:hypothetical protein
MAAGSPDVYDLTPLSSAADESGFGTLQNTLVSPFAALGFSGTITSRVYTDTPTTPGNVATFVWQIDGDIGDPNSSTYVEDVTIAAVGLQNDLRIMQIVNGVNGYIIGTDDPDVALATNHDFPTADSLFYEWQAGDRLDPGETATLYVQVTGVTQLGEVNAAIQNFGGANATVLAPVDDPGSPDLTIPEPTTMALLGLGFVGLMRRRR